MEALGLRVCLDPCVRIWQRESVETTRGQQSTVLLLLGDFFSLTVSWSSSISVLHSFV